MGRLCKEDVADSNPACRIFFGFFGRFHIRPYSLRMMLDALLQDTAPERAEFLKRMHRYSGSEATVKSSEIALRVFERTMG